MKQFQKQIDKFMDTFFTITEHGETINFTNNLKVELESFLVESLQEVREETIKHMDGQIEKLADFIMNEIPGEPSQSEGAVDTAIRLLRHSYHLPCGCLKNDEYSRCINQSHLSDHLQKNKPTLKEGEKIVKRIQDMKNIPINADEFLKAAKAVNRIGKIKKIKSTTVLAEYVDKKLVGGDAYEMINKINEIIDYINEK